MNQDTPEVPEEHTPGGRARGEVVPEQNKRRLQQQSVARFHMVLNKTGEARRLKVEIIRGEARNVVPRSKVQAAMFDLDGRRIEMSRLINPISMSDGDQVLVAGRVGDPFCAVIYFNETTGTGSLESAYKNSRSLLTAGLLCGIGGIAVFLTVVLAARGEARSLSLSALMHVPIYILSLTVGTAVLLFSLFFLAIGMHTRKIWVLVKSVVNAQ